MDVPHSVLFSFLACFLACSLACLLACLQREKWAEIFISQTIWVIFSMDVPNNLLSFLLACLLTRQGRKQLFFVLFFFKWGQPPFGISDILALKIKFPVCWLVGPSVGPLVTSW